MNLGQILAIVIFLAMFAAIIMGKVHRFIPALVGSALVILIVYLLVLQDPRGAINVISLQQLGQAKFWFPGHEGFESRGVNWQTIIFIGGMMVMIEGLGSVGFFRWLCLLLARLVKYKVIPILITFMLLSGFLAMFIDSITVLLFLATVTIELSRLLKFDPIPVIIAEIFAANTGGAATMSGDPPNIIIGTAFGYSFGDFVVNTGVMAWAGMAASLLIFYIVYRRSLVASQGKLDLAMVYPHPRQAITNPTLFLVYSSVFLLVIILLVTHASTGLSVASIGLIAAILTLIFATKGAEHIARRLDWRTLLFFVGLFIVVGGLEDTGVLDFLAEYIGNISGDSVTLLIAIILWFSAFASAIVDNIPFAATMVPVIRHLAETQGIPLTTLAWTLSMGTDIGGNATPIGASANVVGTAIADKEGYPVSWGRYMKIAVPATIIVLAVIWVMLIVRY